MRLIDADALISDLEHDVAMDQDSLDYEDMTEDRREIIQFDKDCKQNAIDLLNHAPTIKQDRSLWFRIGETCVAESKGFISAERAVEKIRELLREGW